MLFDLFPLRVNPSGLPESASKKANTLNGLSGVELRKSFMQAFFL